LRNVGDAARDAYATSHLSAEACTQRLAAGHGDKYPTAAATAAAIARSRRVWQAASTGKSYSLITMNTSNVL